MVCIQIRTDVLSVLNWVQTISKGYQLTRKEWETYEGIMIIQMKDVHL